MGTEIVLPDGPSRGAEGIQSAWRASVRRPGNAPAAELNSGRSVQTGGRLLFWLGADIPLHPIDDILDGVHAVGLAVRNLDLEFCFNLHHEIRHIQAMRWSPKTGQVAKREFPLERPVGRR